MSYNCAGEIQSLNYVYYVSSGYQFKPNDNDFELFEWDGDAQQSFEIRTCQRSTYCSFVMLCVDLEHHKWHMLR